MNPEGSKQWERFLEYAELARRKPTFDAEERDWRLALADAFAEVFHAARDESDDWFEMLLRAHRRGGDFRFMSHMAHRDWLNSWAEASPESARAALSAFLDPGADAEQRFRTFADSVEQAAASRSTVDPVAAITLGSAFNFAIEPLRLPIVRPGKYAALERILGYGESDAASITDEYAHHLGFADWLRSRMEQSGFPARDMIDVQSLILIAVNERDFWTGERIHTIGVAPVREQREMPRRGNAGDDRAAFYLSMCAGYRNEAPYLAEWIEFHRLVGVEHFFLYNARSTDDHREVLAPYIEDGIVTLNPDWEGISYQQADTFTECLRAHGHESRWIAFIDIDEFLFSPTGRPLPELLAEYEPWPAVAVNWALFGRSGHMTKPDGLVIENYLMRSDTPTNLFTKKIVDPSRTVRCVNGRAFDGHLFEFTTLLAVDENHYPIHGTHSKSVSFSRFRLNHYVTKSEEEARRKLGRPDEWVDSRQWRSTMVEDAYPKERDEAAARYVPGVKAALAARWVGQPSDSR